MAANFVDNMELPELCDIEIDIDEEIPVCVERLAGENSYESEEIIMIMKIFSYAKPKWRPKKTRQN